MFQIIQKTLVFAVFTLPFYTKYAFAVNCINNYGIQQYLMQIAKNEAIVAGIPEYKSGMLVDRNSAINKIQLIKGYKKSHLQEPLSENQIEEIQTMENTKNDFLRNNRCKS